MSNRDIEDLAGEGVYYNSFDHLSAGLHRMMKRGHQFRIASSDILRNIDGNQDAKFRYRCLVFHCVHFGQPRRRGKGARQSSYLATGCKAFIRVNYNYTYKSLEVSKSHLSHKGHRLEREPVGRQTICTTHRVNSDFSAGDKEVEQQSLHSKRRSTRVVPRWEFKHTSPEAQLEEQSQYVDFLLAKQRRNYVLYAKQRAEMGLPPFAFNPPPLTYSTLFEFYQLSEKPYVVPKEEPESGDEYAYMEHPNDSVMSNDESKDRMQVVKDEEIASTDNNYDIETSANHLRPSEAWMPDYKLSPDENAEDLLTEGSECDIKEEIVCCNDPS